MLFCREECVAAWVTKIKLVEKLYSIDDIASFILFYLDGPLTLYLEMEEKD